MKFITEFEITAPYTEDNLKWHKFRYIASEMGQLIENSFGLNHRGCTTLNPNDPIKERFTLEIEAFPMDKWVEFRKRLLAALPDHDNTSRIRIENALHDLEHFGVKNESSGQ